jgi:uncharacterized protein with von Willebrand factor type A (vWA) domain
MASAVGANTTGRGAKFFGSESGGNVTRIIYVVDKSGSMSLQFPYVQAELARSIADLKPNQQFSVILFADGKPTVLDVNGQKMPYAVPKAKAVAKEWIDKQIAFSKSGQSDPRKALEVSFTFKPELVYLLTDGLFPKETLALLDRVNSNRSTHVNTIAFKDNTGEKLLKEIANRNNGIYKFISMDELGSDY